MCHTNHEKNYSPAAAMEKIRQHLQNMMDELGIWAEELTDSERGLLIKELKKTKKCLEAVYRRGGVTIITVDHTFITAYRFASYNVRKGN